MFVRVIVFQWIFLVGQLSPEIVRSHSDTELLQMWLNSTEQIEKIFNAVLWSPSLWNIVSKSYEDNRGRGLFDDFFYNYTKMCGGPIRKFIK